MTGLDTITYFNDLEKELNKKTLYRNLRDTLIFALAFIVIILSFIIGEHLYLKNTKSVLNPNMNIQLLLGVGILFFLAICFFFFFSNNTYLKQNLTVLKNNEYVNLYDALSYLYQNEKKKLTPNQFNELIEAKYEKERVKELYLKFDDQKDVYKDIKDKINFLYDNKQKMVLATTILKKNLFPYLN